MEVKVIKDLSDTEQVTQVCKKMISTLSEDEKEKAARTSYKYFTRSINGTRKSNSEPPPTKEERDQHAMAMARRHLIAEKGDINKAIKKMKETILFREEIKIDIMRRCFDPIDEDEEDEETLDLLKEYRSNLERELLDGKLYVRGKSRDGHAMFILESHRNKTGFDPDWFLKFNIYTFERALATTEAESDGAIEKIIAVMNHSQHKAGMSPPMKLSRNLSSTLKDHYPERVEKIFLVDTSFIFRAFWALVKVFVDPITKEKIAFVTGDEEKTKSIGKFVDNDQAVQFILPDGELEYEMDIKRYLHDVPFSSLYDDAKNN